MHKPATVTAATCALFLTLAACNGGSAPVATPTSAAATTTAPPTDVAEHESGPESPITYGFKVPKGATQVGPLVRFRSARLISAFEPELTAALDQKAAEDADRAAQAERDGEPLPSPSPTAETRPSPDTFRPIGDSAPKPDTTISLMRVDGKPADVIRRMAAQIAAAIPDSNVSTTDISPYCSTKDRRVTSCRLEVRGLTSDQRDIRVLMTVDPGNVTTRTSPPSAKTRPVMTLRVEYVGEPRKGQLERQSNQLSGVPEVRDGADTSRLIWPRMDVDADLDAELVNGWKAPAGATILLSGYTPQFVVVTTSTAVEADLIAERFVLTNSTKRVFTKDVVEDLNAVSTTYTAKAPKGAIVRATNVVSARGNYTMLFYLLPN